MTAATTTMTGTTMTTTKPRQGTRFIGTRLGVAAAAAALLVGTWNAIAITESRGSIEMSRAVPPPSAASPNQPAPIIVVVRSDPGAVTVRGAPAQVPDQVASPVAPVTPAPPPQAPTVPATVEPAAPAEPPRPSAISATRPKKTSRGS